MLNPFTVSLAISTVIAFIAGSIGFGQLPLNSIQLTWVMGYGGSFGVIAMAMIWPILHHRSKSAVKEMAPVESSAVSLTEAPVFKHRHPPVDEMATDATSDKASFGHELDAGQHDVVTGRYADWTRAQLATRIDKLEAAIHAAAI